MNLHTIEVTAQDGVTKALYTVNVVRPRKPCEASGIGEWTAWSECSGKCEVIILSLLSR